MNKVLFLKFEGARYFPNQQFTKDRVFEVGNNIPRKEHKQFVEPITSNQISNVLHVLMGERPVPSLRKSVMNRIEDIYDLANSSYLKIDAVTTLNKSNGKNEYPFELMTIRKSVHNAYNTIEIITWERVRQLLENDMFFEFMALLNKLFNEDVFSNYTSKQAMKAIRDKFIDMESYNRLNTCKTKADIELMNSCILNEELKEFINEKFNGKSRNFQKAVMIKYILGYKQTDINSNDRTRSLVPFGIDRISILNGEIIIPLDDKFYNKLRNGNGCATILDGGVVWIDKIVDADDVSESELSGFTKLSEISVEIKQNN